VSRSHPHPQLHPHPYPLPSLSTPRPSGRASPCTFLIRMAQTGSLTMAQCQSSSTEGRYRVHGIEYWVHGTGHGYPLPARSGECTRRAGTGYMVQGMGIRCTPAAASVRTAQRPPSHRNRCAWQISHSRPFARLHLDLGGLLVTQKGKRPRTSKTWRAQLLIGCIAKVVTILSWCSYVDCCYCYCYC